MTPLALSSLKSIFLGSLARSTILLTLFSEISVAEIVSMGEGSYSSIRPEYCKPLPTEIYRTQEKRGKTPTNQWWSSLVWKQYSQPLFAHPLGMVCNKSGLAVSYPGAAIDGKSGNIMGGGIPAGGDFSIVHSAVTEFPDARCASNSDWFITVEFAKDSAKLQTSFGHGSPFLYCRQWGGVPSVRFGDKPQIWHGKDGGQTLGVTVRGNHYGVFGATGSNWKSQEDWLFTNDEGKDYFSIALLPDNRPKTLELFERYAHNHVIDTRVRPSVSGGQIKTSYQFVTNAMEGSGSETITALYPHQWKYTSTSLTEMNYASVRGTMKVAIGKEFHTSIPIQGLLPMLPKEGIPDRTRMQSYLQEEATKNNKEFKDTYWEGKHLGKLATLSGIAEMTGDAELQNQFINEIKKRLENWFTASPDEQSPLFYYNDHWGTLVGSKPSYGSDSQLNDHHFHYGYFIRAAAEVARLDPAWAKKWSPMVNLLIRDIASHNRKDSLFPYVRCFDLYAGHSWASGHADFGDGNNQESSSESMNAWYGLILWGEATGDDVIRDTGLFLYNTERTAVEEYWFDVSGTNFPKDFPNVALGMVWGGKGAFATWFSGDIDCIHGINWLPFTPASIYMGRFPDYVKKNYDRIVAKREGGSDFNTGWGDLVVMFNALNDPSAAVSYLDKNPNCSLEGGNTHAFMYQWINTLDQLGRNDASVTSDHPYVNIYNKGGKKTYAAYNFQASPITVKFSDGTSMKAAPKTITLHR